QRLQFIRQMRALLGLPVREAHDLTIIGQGKMGGIGKQGSEAALVAADAGDGQPAETHAVISLCPPYQPGAPCVAASVVIAARDLKGGIDRLRSRVHKKHMVEGGWSEVP